MSGGGRVSKSIICVHGPAIESHDIETNVLCEGHTRVQVNHVFTHIRSDHDEHRLIVADTDLAQQLFTLLGLFESKSAHYQCFDPLEVYYVLDTFNIRWKLRGAPYQEVLEDMLSVDYSDSENVVSTLFWAILKGIGDWRTFFVRYTILDGQPFVMAMGSSMSVVTKISLDPFTISDGAGDIEIEHKCFVGRQWNHRREIVTVCGGSVVDYGFGLVLSLVCV